MQSVFDADEATQFLRNVRRGSILGPAQLRAELSHVSQHPSIGRYAVEASVPNWLVEKLDPSKRLAHHYTLYPTRDRRDLLLLATMQCSNVQLRCVMQLSDQMVKAFASDAVDKQLFTLFFSIENTKQCAVMSVPLDLAEPQSVLSQINGATRSDAGFAPAVQLAALACSPQFRPSLVEGQTVDDVIAILACSPSEHDVDAAFRFDEEGGQKRERAPLH